MGAADEDVHALSTAEAKPSAATTLTKPDKAATLPFELVLDIMDHAIHHAESIDSLELNWMILRDDSQALGVSFALAESIRNPDDTPQRRFNGIRALLQTSRKIRSMVLGKFYYLCPQAQKGDDVSNYVPTNYVMINPKKDQFMIADDSAWDAVGHPPAALKPLVERMSNIFITNGSFFAPSNSNNIEILQSLPSLRQVGLDIGRRQLLELDAVNRLIELGVGSGDCSIHAELFPDLAEWEESHKSTFPAIWKPFKERGVGLLGCQIVWDFTGGIVWMGKEVWLNTSSDGIYMNLCEEFRYYPWA